MEPHGPLKKILDAFISDPATVTISKDTPFVHMHFAVLLKRGQVIAWATNKYGTRKRGSGWSERSIHAERNVIKELGDISKLRGAEMLIMRITPGEKFGCSKPCAKCEIFLEKCMREYGLRKVSYTA